MLSSMSRCAGEGLACRAAISEAFRVSTCAGGGLCTLERQETLTSALSGFQLTRAGPRKPLEFREQLSLQGTVAGQETVVGGSHRVCLPAP